MQVTRYIHEIKKNKKTLEQEKKKHGVVLVRTKEELGQVRQQKNQYKL